MYIDQCVMEAIERALAWKVPEEALGRVVSEQAALMVSVCPE